MVSSANPALIHAHPLGRCPLVLWGVMGSFLPPQDQAALKIAVDKDFLSHSYTIWAAAMANMEASSLIKILQEPGKQFNPLTRQVFFTDRVSHAEQGKRHLGAREWTILGAKGIKPTDIIERLDRAKLSILDTLVTRTEAKKLIYFFNRQSELIHHPQLQQILAKKEDSIKKAYALCQWHADAKDHEVESGLAELNILPPKRDLPFIAYRNAVEYIKRYQDLLTVEDKAGLAAPGRAFEGGYPEVLVTENLSFRQLNELGRAIAKRESSHFINFLKNLKPDQLPAALMKPLQDILDHDRDSLDLAQQVRKEWLSRPDVRRALEKIQPADLSPIAYIALLNSFSAHLICYTTPLCREPQGTTFERLRSCFHRGRSTKRASASLMTSWLSSAAPKANPIVLKELLKIARIYYPIQNILDSLSAEDRKRVAQPLYERIVTLVDNQQFAPIWLQDALEIGVCNGLLDESQMNGLLSKILKVSEVQPDGLDFGSHVFCLFENTLLDNKTNALLLKWTSDQKRVDILEKFIKISPPIIWKELTPVELLRLWISGVGGKDCLAALDSKGTDELTRAFSQFSAEIQAAAPYDSLSDDVFVSLICGVENSHPSISARFEEIPIDAFVCFEIEFEDNPGIVGSDNYSHHSSAFKSYLSRRPQRFWGLSVAFVSILKTFVRSKRRIGNHLGRVFD